MTDPAIIASARWLLTQHGKRAHAVVPANQEPCHRWWRAACGVEVTPFPADGGRGASSVLLCGECVRLLRLRVTDTTPAAPAQPEERS